MQWGITRDASQEAPLPKGAIKKDINKNIIKKINVIAWDTVGFLPRQAGDAAPLLDAELARPVAPAQCREPLEGDARRSGDELKETKAARVIIPLHHRPEPLDHRVRVVVA